LRDVELKIISELMKNSRRSDRDLAREIHISQPTVTRTRTRLEKEGCIKEYTAIPDFHKLGFEILVITFSRFVKELTLEELEELRNLAKELEKKNPAAMLIAAIGMGLGFNRVFISLHKNYSSYMKTIGQIKSIPSVDPSHIESFVISLVDEQHYQPLTFSTIAKYLEAFGTKK
jgi:DNA-binding Lrp family transcriptional regulator